uniref:Uncharacterized protein n=1 Tax=Dunaliella tertiolecta TaxID=3047 RepID=A0A7S3R2U1_DUNTE|mmetsp:Transcript_4954/g.13481  ORF Transcript_4954/g.13481 Transcript_4954/m.13481 type:complete len:340 (+) Transcript_4954:166-1185(+)
MCRCTVPHQPRDSSAQLVAKGAEESAAPGKRNRSSALFMASDVAPEHVTSLTNWLVGSGRFERETVNAATFPLPRGMPKQTKAASQHRKEDKRRSMSCLSPDVMASYYKPSPFQHADADSKSTYRLLPSTLKAQEGNAVQQGHNQAVASPFRRAEASSAAKPIAVEQALLQSQLCRAQTSVGVTTPFSQRGASLGHLSSSDGSLKSNSTDAGLSRRSTASPVSSSSLFKMPEDSGFLLGPQEQTNSASQEGTASQGLLLPSILGRNNQESCSLKEDSTASIADCGVLRALSCTLGDRPRDFKGLPSFHRSRGRDLGPKINRAVEVPIAELLPAGLPALQ